MTIETAIERLNELELTEFAYNHAMGILSYDGSTGAPKKSAIPRGRTMGVLSGELYKISTGEEAIALVDFLREHYDELSEADKRRVVLREKSLRELRAIPMEEYVAYSELVNDADAVWHEAKEKSDYAMFEPYLARLIAANKRFASLVAPEKTPYDYMLDQFEEGLTTEKCDAFFSALRDRIVPLVEYVKTAKQPDDAVTRVNFPIPKQRELSDRLMEVMGIDRERCAIGETEHPFTTDFTRNDVRITTNYKEDAFLSSMYSVIHEGGHALYELGNAPALSYTSLSGGVSMGIHESQSRFFENIIGRSREFIGVIYPDLVRLCPEVGNYSAEDIYRAANKAEPSLVRTEADELTYSLHIMVRYELERQFMNGDVDTKELPGMWNELYKKYLGVEPTCDRDGILQDSHWSGGAFGYFPSYALGSAYGAQFLAKMQESVDVWGCVSAGNLEPVKAWLEDKIWRFGSSKTPAEILANALGDDFSPTYYLDYLEKKIKDVYSL